MKYLFIFLFLSPINNTYFEYNKPCGQYYTLEQNTPIQFYIPDQLCWTNGKVIYLWGYYPMIYSDYGLVHFNDVIWETRYE